MALGRGLGSLLSGAGVNPPSSPPGVSNPVDAVAAASAEMPNRDRHPGISIASVDEIVANEYQPRRDFDDHALEELAQSIRSNGIIQPLVVRKGPQGYMLIAGERRLRAAKLAGLKQVPIVIRKSTDREALELALIENIQRQNLNCIDEALAYFQLLQDFSLTQEEVALRVGKDRATVANYLRLLRLPEAIIDDLKRQILSFGHGKALLSVDDNDVRLRARKEVVEKKLSVRDTEALIDQLKKGSSMQAAAAGAAAGSSGALSPLKARLNNIAQDLTRLWSARIEIKGSEKRGKIVLHYSSRQELDRMLGAMQNDKTWPVN